jgi:tRNA-splicing ligase RtcB
MGDYSFLVKGLGHEDWLRSCSHGAGRQVRRQDTRRMKQPLIDPSGNASPCVKSADRRAPSAYKPVGRCGRRREGGADPCECAVEAFG